MTEDEGATLRVFPGSETLRYTIPFAPVQDTIDHCWQIAQRHPGAVLTLADDGEKFGSWPNTKAHVYRNGWLRGFFEALTANAGWLNTITLGHCLQQTSPVGKVYLPDCSYREMTGWALPTAAQVSWQQAHEQLAGRSQDNDGWEALQPFVRGGQWRNFRVKYPEANEMYARMVYVSRRLQQAELAGIDNSELAIARDHLYRGQCNCAYWHGTFGGIYLPHLRTAVYQHLIQADLGIDRAYAEAGQGRETDDAYVEAVAGDYDFDLLQEVRLANDHFTLWLAPARGGRLYEWDVNEPQHNLLATLQRRQEAEHTHDQRAQAGSADSETAAGGIDRYLRKSLVDHFYDDQLDLADLIAGHAMERGNFVDQPFEAKIRRASDRVQLQMRRDGLVWGLPVTLTKAVTLHAGSDEIAVTYLLENLPVDREFHFALELNFAGLPGDNADRFFTGEDAQRLGHLGKRLDLKRTRGLAITDQWLGLEIHLDFDQLGNIWTFPVQTLSRNERGLETIQQSVCVMPHWMVAGDAAGRWALQMKLRAFSLAAEPTTRARGQQNLQTV